MTETTAVLAVTAVAVMLATMLVMVVMVFSRTSSGCLRGSSDGSTNANTSIMASLSSRSWKYDVFLSFRGEDTRKTFVDHLYYALADRVSCIYKDDVTLDRGDTIGPSLLNAIQESQIALIIFSKNYADSSWCLDELAYIMKCREERGQIVIPIFYNVDPSDVRKQKGQFGKAFGKHKLANNNKVESWRKALFNASNIAGWEPKQIANGHEAVGIKIIVGTILDKLLSVNSDVDENLVGMVSRFQYLESQLQFGSGGVRMVGIWGVGGGGKTTLAFSVYMKIRDHFQGHCFVGNIWKESTKHGLEKLQEKILSKVLKKQVSVASVQEGRCMIESMLCRRNVLIVLDDVDDFEQLEALAGSRDWFGDGSRIIITTRNKQVLISHKVDVVCPVSLLSLDEAIRLFRRHAYHEDKPLEDYDTLSLRVISYVDGLPLALKILGSFLYGKDKNDWISALDKLKHIPPRKVMDQLKISYDGLDNDEKDLFLDIACFFRGIDKDVATRKLDACGFNPGIGITVLIQKALLTISSDGYIDMHDLVQEMGHDIVRGEHPNNPEKHSRVWKTNEIASMFSGNATTENDKIEAIQYVGGDCSPGFIKLVSNMKKLRFLDVTISDKGSYDEGPESSYDEGPAFLSNELKYIGWSWYGASPFPKSFKAMKLVVLKLHHSLQKELWKGCKQLPCLKELEVDDARHLVRTPDFGGLPCLQKLTLHGCHSLKDIDPSLGNHSRLAYISVRSCYKLTTFPTIVWMEKLERLVISDCYALREFPEIEVNMDSLVNLCLKRVGIEVLPSSVGRCCTNLISLKLDECSELKCIEGNFRALKHLKIFKLTGDTKLRKFPKDLFDEKCCLEELRLIRDIYSMKRLPYPPQLSRFIRKLSLQLKYGEIPSGIGELSNLEEIDLSGSSFSRLSFSLLQFTLLKLLNLSRCSNLVELPKLPSSLAILRADHCESLKAIKDDIHRNCKWLCEVSLVAKYCIIGVERLLESMLQGKAIENHCMSLQVEGLHIANGFEPRLIYGNIGRLQLPENWFNDFSGFLICTVLPRYVIFIGDYMKITMKHEKSVEYGRECVGDEPNHEKKNGWMGIGDYEDEYWDCLEYDNIWVGYVPFSLLRHTAWWNPTSMAVKFSSNVQYSTKNRCLGLGVRLVSRKNQNDQIETASTNSSSEFPNDYPCKFRIHYDSKSASMYVYNKLSFP